METPSHVLRYVALIVGSDCLAYLCALIYEVWHEVWNMLGQRFFRLGSARHMTKLVAV